MKKKKLVENLKWPAQIPDLNLIEYICDELMWWLWWLLTEPQTCLVMNMMFIKLMGVIVRRPHILAYVLSLEAKHSPIILMVEKLFPSNYKSCLFFIGRLINKIQYHVELKVSIRHFFWLKQNFILRKHKTDYARLTSIRFISILKLYQMFKPQVRFDI